MRTASARYTMNGLTPAGKAKVNKSTKSTFQTLPCLKITAKLLADAMHSLPDDKRQAVLLYYFFDMNDVEIAELMKIPRSTVQYRRTSC